MSVLTLPHKIFLLHHFNRKLHHIQLPERPGDGTEEFGDCTVLFEGGFGWFCSTLPSFLTALSSVMFPEQSI